MANILTVNPWILDGSVLNTPILLTQIKIKHMEYVNYTSGQSSIVKVADRFGNTVWYCTGDTTGDNQRSGNMGWIHGLQELTHTDGLLLVFFD
jgi:hypothetical protein